MARVPAPLRDRAGGQLRQFVETIELLANAPLDRLAGDEVVLVSGSGGCGGGRRRSS